MTYSYGNASYDQIRAVVKYSAFCSYGRLSVSCQSSFMTGFAWYYVFGGIKVSDWTGTVDGMCTRKGWSDFPFFYYHVRFLTFVTHCKLWRKLECLGNTTTRPSGQTFSGERQVAVSGNTLDHPAIRAAPPWRETGSSQLQCHRSLGDQGSPSVVIDSEQSVAIL